MEKVLLFIIFVLLAIIATPYILSARSEEEDEEPLELEDIPEPLRKLMYVHAMTPHLVLVNKENKVPVDWNTIVEYGVGKNTAGELFIVEKDTLEHFEILREYLVAAEGIQIEIDSAYRTIQEQQDIWDEWEEEYGLEYCEAYLAPAGHSEHHTGLAIDFYIVKDGKSIRDNDSLLEEAEDMAKIHQHLANFGFILRYPDGKEDTTGYSYEPWHLRYVGMPFAKDIAESGATFEEYIARLIRENEANQTADGQPVSSEASH